MNRQSISTGLAAALLAGGLASAQPVLAHGQSYGMTPDMHGMMGGQSMTSPCMAMMNQGGQAMMGPGAGMMGSGGQAMVGPGTGMMGPGGQAMMGPGAGMMGPGGQAMMDPGAGMMGPGAQARGYLDRDLSEDDVSAIVAHRLRHEGNPRLRVGKVGTRDEDTIVVEVETVDGSLVERYLVDRHTGGMQRGQ